MRTISNRISSSSSSRYPVNRGARVAAGIQQLREPVDAVDEHLALPREVVQADVVELHAARVDVEDLGEVALEPDRNVAQPDRPVPLVEQRLGDEPGRVREVDEPSSRRSRVPR